MRALATRVLEPDGDALYARQPKVYPREVDGRYQRLRTAAVFWLLGMYYLFPWLRWNGRQAVLFDLPARKFYVFGLSFWPQDFVYLAWLLIMAGLALFLFTALAGRVWCGYACPQTVWTEVFLWIERRVEGTRNQRIKLDAAPWSVAKLARKSTKQALWIAFALWTGFTFIGFFTPIRELGAGLLRLDVGRWEGFWMLFYALATYGNAGYLREQVCKYMCPYARFQGAMFDRHTLLIAYDTARGEPRGSRRKGIPSVVTRRTEGTAQTPPLGDCVDCTVCVQVCPTGIDIRQGLQYECIACGACVDGCDAVMDKLGYPRGLVRYTTAAVEAGQRARRLRPRVAIYAALLLASALAFAWSVMQRVPLLIDVLRDRNALYRVGADGAIENAYTLRVINKAPAARRFRIEIEDGGPVALLGAPRVVETAPETVVSVALTLRAESRRVRGRRELRFHVADVEDPAVERRQASSFYAPP
jgi:cytochrome c oxidase accessory protein FixG